MLGLLHVLDIPDHLELGSCCMRLSLAAASELSAELPRASAAGPEVAVVQIEIRIDNCFDHTKNVMMVLIFWYK